MAAGPRSLGAQRAFPTRARIAIAAIAILAASGCTPEKLTSAVDDAGAAIDGRKVAAPSEWKQAAVAERVLLEKLAARFAVHHDTADERRMRQSAALIAILERDSISASEASAVFATSSSGLRFSDSREKARIGGAASLSNGGITIDPFNSWTRFYPRISPNISMQTSVPNGAHWITLTSTGEYTKLGQTYGIMQAAYADPIDLTSICEAFMNSRPSESGEFESLPDGTCLLLRYSLSDISALAINCAKFGVEMNVTSRHQAGYAWPSAIPGAPLQMFVESELTTAATDNGECPHVAPTAHFRTSSYYGGFMGSDVRPLEMREPGMVSIDATNTERDAPIVSYDWTLGLGSHETGFYAYFYADWGATGVRLQVTDALGKTGFADGVIYVYTPPPPPPPRDDGCTIWEISYDGGYTWYPLGTTCP